MTSRREFFGMLAAAPLVVPAVAMGVAAATSGSERIIPVFSWSADGEWKWHWNSDGSGYGFPATREITTNGAI